MDYSLAHSRARLLQAERDAAADALLRDDSRNKRYPATLAGSLQWVRDVEERQRRRDA